MILEIVAASIFIKFYLLQTLTQFSCFIHGSFFKINPRIWDFIIILSGSTWSFSIRDWLGRALPFYLQGPDCLPHAGLWRWVVASVAVMVRVFAARDAWTLELLKGITVSWFVNKLTSSRPEVIFILNILKENCSWLLLQQQLLFWEQLSLSSSSPTKAHMCLQFGRFLLVQDSFFLSCWRGKGAMQGTRVGPRASWAGNWEWVEPDAVSKVLHLYFMYRKSLTRD